ncbi:hypothetical protein J437_LFUL018663 [Ladona fulva]|uniref:CCHC-type domain-containing protein n=1 Tax=Ladona fulva TaxID=123851 RepID=A0A8K0KP90_LADFU|nr:hypothetical protein J437_LFUL018663 [Ladona fulva]
MAEMKNEFKKLKEEMKTIGESIKKTPNEEIKTSYSDVIKGLQRESKTNQEIIIYPEKDANMEGIDEVKDAIKETINPAKEEIQVQSFRKIGRKGVLIRTGKEEEIQKIKSNDIKERLEAKGLKIGEIKKNNPKIIIFRIDREIKEEELMEEIYNQNLKETTVTKENFIQNFKFRFYTGGRNADYCNRVYEVSPEIRKIIIDKEKLYMGWSSYWVNDFLGVLRCFKCYAYGHTYKYCKEKEETCSCSRELSITAIFYIGRKRVW